MIPPHGRQHRPATEPVVHRFEFAAAARPPLAVLGVRPGTAWVRIDGRLLDVRFGRWWMATTLDNVEAVEGSGPLSPVRDIGIRRSTADGALVLASSTRGGVRIRFAGPIPGAGPLAGWQRPTLTVTVAEPDLLIAGLCGAERCTGGRRRGT
jgi:hypothetical protein